MKGMIRTLGILLVMLLVMLTLVVIGGQNDAFVRLATGLPVLLTFIVLVFLSCLLLGIVALFRSVSGVTAPVKPVTAGEPVIAAPQPVIDVEDLRRVLRHDLGWRWKRRLPWILLTGAPSEVERAAPGLTQKGWQRCGGVVLLWGGDMAQGGNAPDLHALSALRGERPVDALVYIAPHEADMSPAVLDRLRYGLWLMQRALRWHPPFYRLNIFTPLWPQSEQHLPLTGVLSAKPFTAESLQTSLLALAPDLIPRAMQLVEKDRSVDYLLRLSASLRQDATTRLMVFFQPLFDSWDRFTLHGVVFSLPQLAGVSPYVYEQRMGNVWQGIAGHSKPLRGRQIGLSARSVLFWFAGALLALWCVGMLFSWFSNAQLVRQAREPVTQSGSPLQRLSALQTVLSTLEDQQHHGTPWYRRFGMDISGSLPPLVWPQYQALAASVIAKPAQRTLQQQLTTPSGDNTADYNRLKALLMLASPERAEDKPAQQFLVAQLHAALPSLSGSDLTFFAAHFSRHPELKITPDGQRVSQVRQRLLDDLTGPQREEIVYRQLLANAGRNYGELSLNQLLDGIDASGVFHLEATVPGAFTRDAWENQIQPEIARLVQDSREQTGWVLVDPSSSGHDDLLPDKLGAALTARYLTAFAAAWKQTLNQITPVTGRDSTQQLAVLTDPNNSPLVMLMRQLSLQGLTASPNEKLGTVNSFLSPVFGGLVAMAHETRAKNGITLKQWMSDTSRLRDRLRSLSAMTGSTQQLATSVFTGTQIDNSASQLPGRVHAQLGGELKPMADALFVAPLGQTWKGVMQGGISQMNQLWQQQIVADWNTHFAGKYPFINNSTDCNLAELGEFIDPTTGKIAAFIRQNLSGVLTYRDGRWQSMDNLPPGLGVSPAFLTSLNRLNDVATVLFSKGFGPAFRLQPGSSRDVVQTELFIDSVKLVYFNQMPFWQDVHWPGDTMAPGASLLWTSTRTGARIYTDQPGQWGLMRLLEKAQAAPAGHNRWRLTWVAEDGLSLNYLLDAEPDQNPLTVLSLKGFRLPVSPFTAPRTGSARHARP